MQSHENMIEHKLMYVHSYALFIIIFTSPTPGQMLEIKLVLEIPQKVEFQAFTCFLTNANSPHNTSLLE